MQWQDQGLVIAVQPLGESKSVITLLTERHGLHKGVLRNSAKSKGKLLHGTHVSVTWKARIDQQLGFWQLETLYSLTAFFLDKVGSLDALLSACSLCMLCLPERQPYPQLYHDFQKLMIGLASPGWAKSYIEFEMQLLTAIGFGLDLTRCAVTGQDYDLVAVSPRTGRAVSRESAEPFKEKLLTLPVFLSQRKNDTPSYKELIEGLRLTGFFFEKHVFSISEKSLPSARERLLACIKRSDKRSESYDHT